MTIQNYVCNYGASCIIKQLATYDLMVLCSYMVVICKERLGYLKQFTFKNNVTIVLLCMYVYMTGFKKTDPNGTFGISRIAYLKYLTHCESHLLGCSHTKCRVGGQPKAGYTFHYDTGSSAVSSLSDRNRLNPQGKLRQSLAAV